MTHRNQIICALDTHDLNEATQLVKKLSHGVGAFKIGHALTLQHGLDVINQLQDAGAENIFLDLKFHDIPHSVGLAVREAAKRGAWMTTIHASGGPEMIKSAAAEKGDMILVGVSVLTSLEQTDITDFLGIQRTVAEHMAHLSKVGMSLGLDGVVCSPHEVKSLREALGAEAQIVTPGIRLAGADTQDQARTGTPAQAIADGASYLVIGRPLTQAEDVDKALAGIGVA